MLHIYLSYSCSVFLFFFFTDPAPTEIYTLSLHDALPISACVCGRGASACAPPRHCSVPVPCGGADLARRPDSASRSEEHTSELQSRPHLVCRLLLEKKKKKNHKNNDINKSYLYIEKTY